MKWVSQFSQLVSQFSQLVSKFSQLVSQFSRLVSKFLQLVSQFSHARDFFMEQDESILPDCITRTTCPRWSFQKTAFNMPQMKLVALSMGLVLISCFQIIFFSSFEALVSTLGNGIPWATLLTNSCVLTVHWLSIFVINTVLFIVYWYETNMSSQSIEYL